MVKDLHELPKLSDSISYIYVDQAIIEQENSSILLIQESGKTRLPVAAITSLLLGLGTRITHAAVKTIAENGCNIVWCGDGVGKYYASGIGETRSAKNLLLQASLCIDKKHLEVVRKMYEIRFPSLPPKDLTLQQIRGMEGIRVRQVYKNESERTGVIWKGRDYNKDAWNYSDAINRAISVANSILYGVCHAAIVSLGYSPGLGFIHTGKMLSFVYDVADFYKTEISIPVAFDTVKNGEKELDKRVRVLLREKLYEKRIMYRIANDIKNVFSVQDDNLESIENYSKEGFWEY